MPGKIIIRTRKSRSEVIAQIAKASAETIGAYAVREVLAENLKDFIRKSSGGADRAGVKWKELEKKTKDKKIRNQKEIRAARRTLKTLAAKHTPRKKKIFSRGHVPINIETRRMVNALRPGTIVEDKYNPPKDQKMTVSGGTIKVSTEVDYAKYASKPRSIMMPNEWLTKWERTGIKKGREAIAKKAKSRLRK